MALSNPFGDTTYTKVFVGGLAWETQSDTIRRHFEQFGEILEAVVISDKLTGRSKGYGFVTFRDPESARNAFADPNPVIDGRKANCNLASLGRIQPYFPYGRIQPIPYFGMPQMPGGTNIGSPSFQQPGTAGYQPGIACPSYGFTPHGPEFVYSQGVYYPYMGQHYRLVYGPAGPINTSIGPYGQMGASLRGTTIQGFVMPNLNVPQYVGTPVSVLTSDMTAAIQTPYGQPRMFFPGHPPQFTWNRSSNQTTG